MSKYFGTDGFRGKAGVNLTADHAFKIGRFLGWYFSQKHKGDRARIVIGKDTRRSSYMYESSLSAGITSSGADAYLLHPLHLLLTSKSRTHAVAWSLWSIIPKTVRVIPEIEIDALLLTIFCKLSYAVTTNL